MKTTPADKSASAEKNPKKQEEDPLSVKSLRKKIKDTGLVRRPRLINTTLPLTPAARAALMKKQGKYKSKEVIEDSDAEVATDDMSSDESADGEGPVEVVGKKRKAKGKAEAELSEIDPAEIITEVDLNEDDAELPIKFKSVS